ncbi:hypothetical protein BOCO_0805 [Bombiscardovia coagulans]|uniref:Uncharacterized protein n=2 Tax=Bombiscardovia coagulans TaxID=686666 RepID=A0A261ETU8_9BIFI|nr:hypothetical protein BOCO_0805 [Bombiscardovia coagulans]
MLLLSAIAVSLGGCSPLISIQETDPPQEHVELSLCDQAWTKAHRAEQFMADPLFSRAAGSRTIEPLAASHAWSEVAVNCPTRLEEAVTRSALALTQANTRQAVTQPYEMTADVLPSLASTASVMSVDELVTAAKAEDEAGFATTVLAGRNSSASNFLLQTADHHHTAAQTFALTLSGSNDPRQGVYSVEELLRAPQVTVDPSTQLQAPTPAIVEINCARSLLKVTNDFSISHAAAHQSGEGRLKAGLTALTQLAIAHVYTAFLLGYPTFDQALFQSLNQ